MNRTAFLMFPMVALLAACNDVAPQAKAADADDARAVAMVEGAQHRLPPAKPLVPQAIAELELAGADCHFADLAHAAGRPILVAGPQQAALRVDGQLVTFAADAGSTKLPGKSWSRYTGRQYALRFEPQPTPAAPAPNGFSHMARQPVSLTVTDEHERKVLVASGDLTCS